MTSILVLAHLIALVWIGTSAVRIWELNGGAGKGVWSRSSIVRMNAEENLRRGLLALALLLAADGLMWWAA